MNQIAELLIIIGKSVMIILYIILGIFLLLILMQYLTVLSAKKSKGMHLTDLNKRLKILEGKRSRGLVYFFSPSCRACRSLTPIIKDMQSKHKNVFDIDISKDLDTARKFGIKATPTTIFVEGGVIKQVFLGVKNKEVLEGYLRE